MTTMTMARNSQRKRHTLYRILEAFLITHQHLHDAIIQHIGSIWQDANVLLRFVLRPWGRVELRTVRDLSTEAVRV